MDDPLLLHDLCMWLTARVPSQAASITSLMAALDPVILLHTLAQILPQMPGEPGLAHVTGDHETLITVYVNACKRFGIEKLFDPHAHPCLDGADIGAVVANVRQLRAIWEARDRDAAGPIHRLDGGEIAGEVPSAATEVPTASAAVPAAVAAAPVPRPAELPEGWSSSPLHLSYVEHCALYSGRLGAGITPASRERLWRWLLVHEPSVVTPSWEAEGASRAAGAKRRLNEAARLAAASGNADDTLVWLHMLQAPGHGLVVVRRRLVRSLVRAGLPPSLRGFLWTRFARGAGASKLFSPHEYMSVLADYQLSPTTARQIEVDILRTGPHLRPVELCRCSAPEGSPHSVRFVYRPDEAADGTATTAAMYDEQFDLQPVDGQGRVRRQQPVEEVSDAHGAASGEGSADDHPTPGTRSETAVMTPHDRSRAFVSLRAITRVLQTFAATHGDMEYCQGFNWLAAHALRWLSEPAALKVMELIICQLMPENTYTDLSGAAREMRVLGELIASALPDIVVHLMRLTQQHAESSASSPGSLSAKRSTIDIPSYSEAAGTLEMLTAATLKWFVCLFVIPFPAAVADRVWDSVVFEGSKVLHRLVLTLLRLATPRIMAAKSFGEAMMVLEAVPSWLAQKRVFTAVFDMWLWPLPRIFGRGPLAIATAVASLSPKQNALVGLSSSGFGALPTPITAAKTPLRYGRGAGSAASPFAPAPTALPDTPSRSTTSGEGKQRKRRRRGKQLLRKAATAVSSSKSPLSDGSAVTRQPPSGGRTPGRQPATVSPGGASTGNAHQHNVRARAGGRPVTATTLGLRVDRKEYGNGVSGAVLAWLLGATGTVTQAPLSAGTTTASTTFLSIDDDVAAELLEDLSLAPADGDGGPAESSDDDGDAHDGTASSSQTNDGEAATSQYSEQYAEEDAGDDDDSYEDEGTEEYAEEVDEEEEEEDVADDDDAIEDDDVQTEEAEEDIAVADDAAEEGDDAESSSAGKAEPFTGDRGAEDTDVDGVKSGARQRAGTQSPHLRGTPVAERSRSDVDERISELVDSASPAPLPVMNAPSAKRSQRMPHSWLRHGKRANALATPPPPQLQRQVGPLTTKPTPSMSPDSPWSVAQLYNSTVWTPEPWAFPGLLWRERVHVSNSIVVSRRAFWAEHDAAASAGYHPNSARARALSRAPVRSPSAGGLAQLALAAATGPTGTPATVAEEQEVAGDQDDSGALAADLLPEWLQHQLAAADGEHAPAPHLDDVDVRTPRSSVAEGAGPASRQISGDTRASPIVPRPLLETSNDSQASTGASTSAPHTPAQARAAVSSPLPSPAALLSSPSAETQVTSRRLLSFWYRDRTGRRLAFPLALVEDHWPAARAGIGPVVDATASAQAGGRAHHEPLPDVHVFPRGRAQSGSVGHFLTPAEQAAAADSSAASAAPVAGRWLSGWRTGFRAQAASHVLVSGTQPGALPPRHMADSARLPDLLLGAVVHTSYYI